MAAETAIGLRWHARALLHRRRWRATSGLIANWLATTRPASRHLLLIGGSAGWMMSSQWLQGFERIDVVDLDRFAPYLFRFNHGRALRASGTALRFHQLDGIAGLEQLLQAFPDASLFFDNVLGQHRYREQDQDRAEADLRALSARLRGRDWGSVHDLFSGPVAALKRPADPVNLFHAEVTPAGLTAGGLCGDALHRLMLAQSGASGPWMDHFTAEVFPAGTASALIAWPFFDNYGHWLQAGWVGQG